MEFTIDAETMAHYQRAVALLSNREPGRVTAEAVFTYLLEFMLERKDPVRRHARRATREEKQRTREQESASEMQRTHERKPARENRGGREDNRTRTIPAATRDAVFTRDAGRCTFRGSRGKRCGTHTRLHIDHVVPFALGGSNEPENLRLLCAAHNQLMAERMLGAHTPRRRE